jgi:hypothetical protein
MLIEALFFEMGLAVGSGVHSENCHGRLSTMKEHGGVSQRGARVLSVLVTNGPEQRFTRR